MKKLMNEVSNAKRILREEGIKALFRKYGWKLVAVIFGYYIIRDVTIYILIPMTVLKFM